MILNSGDFDDFSASKEASGQDNSPAPGSSSHPLENGSLPTGPRKQFRFLQQAPDASVFATHGTEDNLPPPANSALSIRNYNPRVAVLLAEFFGGEMSRAKRAELSGLLVFPHSKHAADLYKRAMTRGPSDRQKVALRGWALYPEDKTAVDLFLKQTLRPEKVTPEETLKINAVQVHPGDSRKQQQYVQQVLRQEITDLEPRERAARLEEFVRNELLNAHGATSSNYDLAVIFNLEMESIHDILQNKLTSDERRVRDIRLSNRHNDETYALKNLITTAVRSVVRIENELHESGIISTLSSPKALAQLFGVSTKEMNSHLRFTPSKDHSYRSKILTPGEQLFKQEFLFERVQNEIEHNMNGTGDRLTSDSELAEEIGVLPVTIFHNLSKTLSNHDRLYRDFVLKQRGALSNILNSPTQFVQEELEAFRKGEIDSIHSIPELAELFQVSPDILTNQLLEGESALSPSDVRYRRLILNLQGPKDASSEALRQVVYTQLKERIERHRAANNKADGKGARVVLDKHGREARVSYRGTAYDSFEEAATALLLEKYIPGFQAIPGNSMQVEINGRFLDFVLDQAVIEYHPILLFKKSDGFGSFSSYEDYKNFNEIKKSLGKTQRKLFVEETRQRLADEYRKERQEVLSQSTHFRDRELIVATSAAEVYYLVVKRFGEGVPSFEKFKREFNRMTARVRKANTK